MAHIAALMRRRQAAGRPRRLGGGTGAGPEEIMIVMEQLGRGLVIEPFLSTVVLCGGLIAKAGTLRQREAMQPRIAEGALTLALAHGEPGSRWNLADVTTRAEGKRSDFVLNGMKTGALFADSADTLIVSARLEGGRRQERGIALFLVPRTAPGVVVRATPTFDGLRTAEVTLTDVVVPVDDVLGPLGLAFPKLEAAVDAATAALCAEAVGTMARLNELTLEHLKTRQQFGQPLGANLVLRHRMVDMSIACEEARSMMLLATMHAADPDPVARRRAVSAAKAQVGRAASGDCPKAGRGERAGRGKRMQRRRAGIRLHRLLELLVDDVRRLDADLLHRDHVTGERGDIDGDLDLGNLHRMRGLEAGRVADGETTDHAASVDRLDLDRGHAYRCACHFAAVFFDGGFHQAIQVLVPPPGAARGDQGKKEDESGDFFHVGMRASGNAPWWRIAVGKMVVFTSPAASN
jgi:alkylation response protein AidB-like acyl-CoA dehydrogenase